MTLPLAHVGHYLWIFYLLPVIFVIAGIVKTTLSEKRRRGSDDEEESHPDVASPDEDDLDAGA